MIFALLLIFLLPGCGGKGGDNPATPPVDGGPETPGLTAQNGNNSSGTGQSGGKALWGMWDISLSRDGVEVVPLRGIEYVLNVNSFLQPPMGTLDNLKVNMINMEKLFIAGDTTVDVTLKHPFPELSIFTGFDVMGVIIGTGTYCANSDIGILYGDPGVDLTLMNADGYTRWMNQLEFTSGGIRGFTEGAMGKSGMFWGSTLNGYKYFATDLYATERISDHYQSLQSVNNRGMFSTDSSNTRRYELHFPMKDGFPDARFQYAVIASWVEPIIDPPENIPGDFPPEANLREAFHCEISTVGSTLYWNDMYDNGGDLFLTLEVFDWQGVGSVSGVVGEIKQIILDSPDEFINHGSKMVFNPGDWTELAGTCDNSVKLALDVGAVELGGPCPFDNDTLVTIVTAEEGNYDNSLGGAWPTQAILSGYARLFYDLGNICNNPPILWFDNCPTGTLSVANKTFRWDAEDDVTMNNQLEFRYKIDGEAWSDWEIGVKQAYFENMTEDEHTIYVECRDLDGQVSAVQCNFTIELPPEPQPPSVGFTNCTTYVRSASKTFYLDLSDDYTPISQLKVRYSFEGSGWIDLPDGSTSVTLNGLVSGGPFQLLVEVTDLDGMPDQAMCEFSVNFQPSVVIDNCPGLDLNVNSYTFNWTGVDPDLDPLEYQYRLDLSGWSVWAVGTSANLAGLTSGNHTFYVNVRDTTGGIDQAQCNFSVNFGPSITITNKPAQDVNTTNYIFNWNATDDLDSPLTMEYNVQLDGVWQGWVTGTSSYDWTSLPSGLRSFLVRVRDTGNPGLTDEDNCNFNVNYKPSVTIDNCPGGIWPSSDITFNWTGSDDNDPPGGMEYSYKLDANPWSAWLLGLQTVALSGLSDANHTFSVMVRDNGNPVLQCNTFPDTCDSCAFTVDASCAFPPLDVQNFAARDTDPLLYPAALNREVELTWDALPGCVDFYDIEKYEYNWGFGIWEWNLVQSVAHPGISWMDTGAPYCGPVNPISYRITARNISGSSPTPQVDTGYPIPRYIHMALWCVADDNTGTNPATTWTRAAMDWADCNTFWNDYGLDFVLENVGELFWIGDPSLKNPLGTGTTDLMHATYGQVTYPDAINVYYVSTYQGSSTRGWCRAFCPGVAHNTQNVYILLCSDTRGIPPTDNPIVLAHECGHGVGHYWDIYLLDVNGNQILDDGTSCAVDNTFCTGVPGLPPLFCDENAAYPQSGIDPPVPKQLMWYSYVGSPIADYTLYETQWVYFSDWVIANEANYPWP